MLQDDQDHDADGDEDGRDGADRANDLGRDELLAVGVVADVAQLVPQFGADQDRDLGQLARHVTRGRLLGRRDAEQLSRRQRSHVAVVVSNGDTDFILITGHVEAVSLNDEGVALVDLQVVGEVLVGRIADIVEPEPVQHSQRGHVVHVQSDLEAKRRGFAGSASSNGLGFVGEDVSQCWSPTLHKTTGENVAVGCKWNGIGRSIRVINQKFGRRRRVEVLSMNSNNPAPGREGRQRLDLVNDWIGSV